MTNDIKGTSDAKGTLRAFLNPDKVRGDSKPAFEGKLTLPGSDLERPLALWTRQRKEDGAVMLTGRVEQPRGAAMDQINQLIGRRVGDLSINDGKLKLKPGEIDLFESRGKTADATPSTEKGAATRPDFYGWHHTGDAGRGLVDLGVWAKTDTNGRTYLAGSVKERPAQPQHVAQPDQEPEPAV